MWYVSLKDFSPGASNFSVKLRSNRLRRKFVGKRNVEEWMNWGNRECTPGKNKDQFKDFSEKF